MSWWIWLAIVVAAWLVLGKLWKAVIQPYFRSQEVDIRTSVMPEERAHANAIDDNVCCVCLAEPKVFRVVATCSHSFCADCLFRIYNSRGQVQIDCPLCRKDIVTIFKSFPETQPAERIARIREQIRQYNRKFGDDRSIKRTIKELPFILTQTLNYVFSTNFLLFLIGNSLFIKGILFLVAYWAIPYDLLTVSVVGNVGYVDNVLIFIFVSLFVVGKVGLSYILRQQ